jgi:hypothetical protein
VVARTAGDPGGQEVVRVLDEVIADEYVEEVDLAVQVSRGEHDELTFPGGRGEAGRAVEQVLVPREHRRRDEQRSRGRGRGSRDHLVGGERVATDEAVQERGLVCGHETTVRAGADDALTMP